MPTNIPQTPNSRGIRKFPSINSLSEIIPNRTPTLPAGTVMSDGNKVTPGGGVTTAYYPGRQMPSPAIGTVMPDGNKVVGPGGVVSAVAYAGKGSTGEQLEYLSNPGVVRQPGVPGMTMSPANANYYQKVAGAANETNAINALRNRIASIPTVTPGAPDPEVIANARRREYARQMGGVPDSIANANKLGKMEAEERIKNLPREPHSIVASGPLAQEHMQNPRGWDRLAADREAAAAREAEGDKAYRAEVAAGHARMHKDSDGDGISDRDETIASKFGKYNINSFSQLQTATAAYNNYLKEWRAYGKKGRPMKSEEFFAYQAKEENKKPAYLPGQGAAEGLEPVEPQRKNIHPEWRQRLAQQQGFARGVSADARAHGMNPFTSNQLYMDTLRQQDQNYTASQFLDQKNRAEAAMAQSEQANRLAVANAQGKSAADIAKAEVELRAQAAEQERKAREDAAVAAFNRERDLKKLGWDREDALERRNAQIAAIEADPANRARATFSEVISNGGSVADARAAAQQEYANSLPRFNALTKAYGVEMPASPMPELQPTGGVSLPEGGLLTTAALNQVERVKQELIAQAKREGRPEGSVTDHDIERALNANGLTHMSADYNRKANIEKASGSFGRGFARGLGGPLAEAALYGF